MTKEDFLKEVRERNKQGMELGITKGWWPSYDDRGPHPWPWCYVINDKELKREIFLPKYGFSLWEVVDSEYPYMSQLLHRIGVFDSVTDARKAGFNKVVQPGEFWFKKRTIHLFVEEE